MKTITRIGPKSVAKMLGTLYAIFGFIGLFFSLITLGIEAEAQPVGFDMLVFGIGAPIFLPLAYGLMGVVFGYVSAWLYNAVAKKVGGIEVEAVSRT